ncbi:hypothetical protein [Actinomadura parmotrematis]|uniref:DUF3040 domain-containing protein n=1 Tax=Actinomadura parmotrematis TaxID=2864039 RepID=A0ABS7FN63_9ACTN|nr:hypothetical protein [Actinomadura parmotrematis]MBW8481828.1 hypothetical protein [Actinomadura parmotrematis]
MGAPDDFGLWERELRPEPEDGDGGRGLLRAAVVIVFGCVLAIVLGDVALGVAGLVLAGLIVVLWRAGL